MKQATARAAANWRRVYAMPVASVYPSYIAKAEKKGRTRAEVDEVFRLHRGHSAIDEQQRARDIRRVVRR